MSASTSSPSKASPSSMIVLIFSKRRVIVPRPISYEAAVNSARKYFFEIPLQSTVKFLCDELDICQGQLAEIPEESWREVINDISSLTVTVFITRNGSPCPSVGSSATLVPREPFSSSVLSVLAHEKLTADLLVSEPNRKIRIIIVNFEASVSTFKCLPSMSIRDLHDLYIKQTGGREHHLVYMGKYLDLDKRLCDYGFGDGTAISSVRKLVGGKPVIYLFSPKEIEASVLLSLIPEWRISAIYPVVPVKEAVNGQGQTVVWRVQTKANGDLTELNTGLDVSYLFWEAHTEGVASVLSPPASPAFDESAPSGLEYFNPAIPNLTISNSVILPAEKITPYLDKALNALGLHTEARTSFITYWLPSFLKHKHIALRFLPQAAYERAAPLNVSPEPDITTRIFMLFKGIQDDELAYWGDAIKRASQDVRCWVSIVGVDVERVNGSSLFRVLEWGGMEVLGVTELGIEA